LIVEVDIVGGVEADGWAQLPAVEIDFFRHAIDVMSPQVLIKKVEEIVVDNEVGAGDLFWKGKPGFGDLFHEAVVDADVGLDDRAAGGGMEKQGARVCGSVEVYRFIHYQPVVVPGDDMEPKTVEVFYFGF
jgi:hypothetical protein